MLRRGTTGSGGASIKAGFRFQGARPSSEGGEPLVERLTPHLTPLCDTSPILTRRDKAVLARTVSLLRTSNPHSQHTHPQGSCELLLSTPMARHGMRKGPSKKSKSSLNQASASTKGEGTSVQSTKGKTTRAGKGKGSEAGTSRTVASSSSAASASASASTTTAAPPINYDVIEGLERPAKLVQLDRQLKITKTSTASLGKYDNKLKGEPLREKGKKRQFESNEIKDSESERAKYLDILGRLDEEEIKKRRKEGAALETTNELVNVRKAIRGASRGRGSANLAGSEKKGKGKISSSSSSGGRSNGRKGK